MPLWSPRALWMEVTSYSAAPFLPQVLSVPRPRTLALVSRGDISSLKTADTVPARTAFQRKRTSHPSPNWGARPFSLSSVSFVWIHEPRPAFKGWAPATSVCKPGWAFGETPLVTFGALFCLSSSKMLHSHFLFVTLSYLYGAAGER